MHLQYKEPAHLLALDIPEWLSTKPWVLCALILLVIIKAYYINYKFYELDTKGEGMHLLLSDFLITHAFLRLPVKDFG